MWNAAKRVKFGLDQPAPAQPAPIAFEVVPNPDSPPNGPDVQVFNPSNFWQSENSIGVNFSNSNQLMVSTNGQIPGSNPVVQQPWAFSTDGGITWPASLQSESIPPGILDCYGDPVAFFDRSGRAYYSTLGSPGGIYFVSTTNFGATWSARSDADNLHSTNDDKQHAAADYSGTYPNNVYTAWTDFGVSTAPVQFARSTDQGATWQTRVQLAIGSNRGQGTNIAIGPNGEVYVFWGHYTSGTAEVGIGMAKSTDGGATFNTPAVVFPINGTRISNGGITQLNGTRTSSFPHADVDRSNGARRGWIYVCVPELDVANTGQSDIYVYRSTDGGTTWSSRIKVNGPDVVAGRWQWMPSIAVDPTTSGITVSYYSFDSTGSTTLANRYAAYSGDGGTTWDNWVISDARATWAPQLTPNTNTTYNGDYYETAAMDGKAWPCWTDRRLGASGTFNRAYVERIVYSENFGFVKGIVTALGTSTPVSGAAIDFVQPVLQQGATTDPTGFYFAGAKVDTPGTTANLTLRARKFGYVDTTLPVTLTRFDTLTRNFQMRVAPGGTLDVYSHTPTGNLRSYVEVKFGTLTVVSDSTNATTGHLTAPLPTGTYSVRVDAPEPYVTKAYPSVVINAGATTNIDALTNAVFTFAPSSVRDTLPVGGSRTKTLAITNNTADSVNFRITDDNARITGMRVVVPVPAVQVQPVQKPKDAPDTDHGMSPNGHGGPDAFGYSWIDSDDPGGPIYNWSDIKGVGTQITTWTGGTPDDGYATIPLPFTFTFYGNSYTSANASTNGNIQFAGTSTAYSNDQIPSSAVPNNAIYPFWDDLNFNEAGGTLWYYNDVANSRFIIQYDSVSHYSPTSTPGRYTFQVILKPSGEVLVQYRSMVGTLNSATIGVENAAGTVALQVVYNANYVHDNLALRFYLPDASWLSETPVLGRIPPGAVQNIQCTFDATGLTAGTTYNANVFVEPTHPDMTGRFTVPASLRVQLADSAIAVFTKNTVAFNNVQINTTKRDTNWARNVGALTLNISSITSTNPKFVVTPASGTVAPGDSLRMVVAYTPTTVTNNDTGRVIFLSNSQGTPRKDIPLTGTSLGAPAISVSVTSIADTMQVGQSHSKTFTITNTTAPPTAPLYVSITDSATWLNVTPALDTLAGSQTKNYTTTFNATGLSIGTYTTNIRIVNNDPANPLKIVAATLRVVGGPIISARPDSIVKSIASGGSGVDSFYIKNTGVSALNWSMSEVPGEAPDINRANLRYHGPMPEMPKGMDYPAYDNPDSAGGPDAYGYRWIDSDSPGGPTYNWTDITGVGTQITTWSIGTADDGYATIPLPFSFTFYGNPFSTINVCTNGFLSFTSTVTGSASYTNAPIPTAGEPNNVLAGFWDDLNLSTSGTVHYYNDAANSRFIVQYTNVPYFSGTGTCTFQVILKATGEIIYQYNTMSGTLVSSTVGIENGDGTIGLQTAYNSAYVHNNLAVLYSRGISWLDETPTSGTVNPGDSAKVRLTFNTTGLTAGTYRGILSIASNDFSHNPFNYVVRLTVTGGGTPTLTVTSPNGGEQWTIGLNYNITWNQSNVDSVTISYSTTGRTGTYTNIASVPARPEPWIHPKELVRPSGSTINDNPLGTFAWTIPNTPSTNCFVRIVRKSTGTPGDTSDAAFTIQAVQNDTAWVAQTSGTTTAFYAVKAIDINTAWAGGGTGAGTSGFVRRTTDGGATWPQVGTFNADVYAMTAIDANTAIAANYTSTYTRLVRTTNGGATWATVDSVAGGFYDYIHMFNATNGYAMGDPTPAGGNWVLKRTTNGGATWTTAATLPAGSSSEAGWNNSMQWLDANNGWFGTNNSKIYRTTDGGATWTGSATSFVNSYSVGFAALSTGLTGSDTGPFNKSTDGGATWTTGPTALAAANLGMWTNPGSQEFWVASGNNINYSSNFGTSWSSAPKNGYTGTAQQNHVNMVKVGSSIYGWAVGNSGTVARYRRIVTGVDETPSALPEKFALNQNFPNPFNPSTKITYDLPEQATLTLKVYNVLGQEVATLVNGTKEAGSYQAVWDGHNMFGASVSSGIYFFRMDATSASGTTFNSLKKMIFLK